MRVLRYAYTGKEIRTFKEIWLNWSRRGLKQHDNGDQEKIFDRFYQADKSKDGSGLGLAIAKELCRQNGWKIICENQNHRTRFIVIFNK